MTIEEINRILQTVAENQAKHDEMHSRHSADIAEIDKGIESLLRSQTRYEERLAMISDILHDLADKQLKNEERFADLAAAQLRSEKRQDTLEASYELLEDFVRNFRRETNGYFAETDKRLAALAEAQIRTGERFAETDRKLAALAAAQARTDEQMKRTDKRINALAESQARTDAQIRALLEHNGSPKPKAGAKTAIRKAATKKGAKKKGGAAK